LGLCLWATAAGAGEGLWMVGMRVQGTVDFEPGNDYFIGPEIGYSDFNLASHRLQLKAAYLTSRMEQAFRPPILKQDYFLLSPIWHFGRNSLFDPLLKADLGYYRYDVVSKSIFGSLDNDSWIASLQLGLGLNLAQGQYGLDYHVGYNLIAPQSGLVYPVVFGLSAWMML